MATVTKSGEIIPKSTEDRWRVRTEKHREFDAGVRRHNVANLTLGLLGIFFSFAALEIKFRNKDADEVLEDNDEGLGRETAGSFACKVTASFLTLVLLVSIAMYYRRHALGRSQEWYVDDSPSWTARWKWYMALELLLCAVHPPPVGIDAATDSRYVVTMIVRLYLIARVVRDNTAIYLDRFMIMRHGKFAKFGRIGFNSLLCVKVLFNNHAWLIVTVLIAISVPFAAFVLFLYERGVQPDLDYVDFLYLTAITMSTVGYGDIQPLTNPSRAIAVSCALVGIVLAAILVTVLIDTLSFSESYERTQSLHRRILLREEQMRLAAVVIQKTWRVVNLEKMAAGAFSGKKGGTRVSPGAGEVTELESVGPGGDGGAGSRAGRRPPARASARQAIWRGMSIEDRARHVAASLGARKALETIKAELRILEQRDFVRGDFAATQISLVRGVRSDVAGLAKEVQALRESIAESGNVGNAGDGGGKVGEVGRNAGTVGGNNDGNMVGHTAEAEALVDRILRDDDVATSGSTDVINDRLDAIEKNQAKILALLESMGSARDAAGSSLARPAQLPEPPTLKKH